MAEEQLKNVRYDGYADKAVVRGFTFEGHGSVLALPEALADSLKESDGNRFSFPGGAPADTGDSEDSDEAEDSEGTEETE